jgi:hypothetical protein
MGLAVPLRLVRQVPPRREVASEAVTGAWGHDSGRCVPFACLGGVFLPAKAANLRPLMED